MPTKAFKLERLRIPWACRTTSLRTSDVLRGFRVMGVYGMAASGRGKDEIGFRGEVRHSFESRSKIDVVAVPLISSN